MGYDRTALYGRLTRRLMIGKQKNDGGIGR